VKVLEIQEGFGLEHLGFAERPIPDPGPGQVLLRMRAVALNYRDLLTVRGEYNPRQPLPLIPCSDGVGEVRAVGEGVKRVSIGDRVIPIFAQRWIAGAPTREKLRSTLGGPLDGTLAEYVALDAEGLVLAPAHLEDEEAASLPCSALTAWNALAGEGPVSAGDTVLVEGTGGVAIFALQIAQLLGARVIVTSSSNEKLERARSLGAWETINYREEREWGKQARRLTDGLGVNVVVEVGGAETLAQALAAVAFGGQISLIGNLTGGSLDLNIVPLFMRQIRLQGILVGHRDGLETMNREISAHGMRPVIDRVFSFEECREALEHMAGGGHFGKICIRF
jgi:NADPH:quinone reductase-like Zn-dependent oxidoreductase